MTGYPYPDALWVLEVPEATPSLNEFANKRSKFIYGRIRARWFRLLRDAWMDALRTRRQPNWAAPPRARLTVYRISTRQLDDDNAAGGLKPVLDVLRTLGFIRDDSPTTLRLTVHQQLTPPGATRKGGTLLVLEHWPADVPKEAA